MFYCYASDKTRPLYGGFKVLLCILGSYFVQILPLPQEMSNRYLFPAVSLFRNKEHMGNLIYLEERMNYIVEM